MFQVRPPSSFSVHKTRSGMRFNLVSGPFPWSQLVVNISSLEQDRNYYPISRSASSTTPLLTLLGDMSDIKFLVTNSKFPEVVSLSFTQSLNQIWQDLTNSCQIQILNISKTLATGGFHILYSWTWFRARNVWNWRLKLLFICCVTTAGGSPHWERVMGRSGWGVETRCWCCVVGRGPGRWCRCWGRWPAVPGLGTTSGPGWWWRWAGPAGTSSSRTLLRPADQQSILPSNGKPR